MNNRNRGHNYERKIVNFYKELGFEDVVTTRSESKRMDDKKVDVFTPHYSNAQRPLPFYVQCKLSTDKRMINYHQLFSFEHLPKDKPYIVHHKVASKKTNKFVQAGEYVIMSSDFYKELIKLAYDR
jgi:Holliday junction resolvase